MNDVVHCLKCGYVLREDHKCTLFHRDSIAIVQWNPHAVPTDNRLLWDGDQFIGDYSKREVTR